MTNKPSAIVLSPGEHVDDVVAMAPGAAPTQGATRLILAVLSKEAAPVAELLALGADPDKASANGITPLMFAVVHGQRECFDLLLAAGAGHGAIDKSYRTALTLAAGADVDPIDMRGLTPLAAAVSQGRLDMARTLIGAGADPQAATGAGTPMRDFLLGMGVSEDVLSWMETAAEARALSGAVKSAPPSSRSSAI